MSSNKQGLTYRDAGVDIDAGNRAVELMKESVKRTYTPNVLGSLGGFGGLYSLAGHTMKEPVLVSGTDGVGTKLRLAIMMDKHDTIGQDCVAMSVNDILVQGATPLFFLDYIAVGKVIPEQVAHVVSGVAKACEESGCALIGGETAEMAGFYDDGDYDIAGFAVGIVDKEQIITGESIEVGDVLLGLPSSGVHSNGFSLVRHIVLEAQQMTLDTYVESLGKTIGEELLTPTKLYVKSVLPLVKEGLLKGLVHITGGGFYDNIPRILPPHTGVTINSDAWPVMPIFKELQAWGQVEPKEMYRTFNMGIGMVLVVKPEEVERVVEMLTDVNETVYQIGVVTEGNQTVTIEGDQFHG